MHHHHRTSRFSPLSRGEQSRGEQSRREKVGVGRRAVAAGRSCSLVPPPLSGKGRGRAFAFTLVEMLVVLSIIAIAAGLAFPAIRKLAEFSRGAGGANAVSVAVNAASIYNHRLHGTAAQLPPTTAQPTPGYGSYSGTAVLFTSHHNIRLVINDGPAPPGFRLNNGQLARDQGGDYLENLTRNGEPINAYVDIAGIDYVVIPESSGVAGVVRRGAGPGGRVIVPPPFAIRFNEEGKIATDQPFIYYDGNNNSRINLSAGGGNGPPDNFPASFYNGYDLAQVRSSLKLDAASKRYHVNFEKIPVVNAVILYDAHDFRSLPAAEQSFSNNKAWFLKNGQPLYFSPVTGLVMGGK